MGRYGEAERLYDKASRMSPANPDFFFEKAQLLWSESKYGEAEDALREALRVHPSQYRALVSLTLLEVGQGHTNNALTLLPQINACNPVPPLNMSLATARQVRGIV